MKKMFMGVFAGLFLAIAGMVTALELNAPLTITGGSATGLSLFQPYYAVPTAITATSYTQLVTDSTVIVNAGGTSTFTLLAASSYPGKRLRILTIASQTVVSASSNVTPCTSGTAGTAILAGTAGKFAELESDGTNWRITACN